MLSHCHDLGNNRLLGPVHSEHLRELPQVLGSSLPNREDSVTQPTHAEITKLLVKELDAELAGKERNVFDNGKANPPLLVLRQLHDGRQQ